MAASTTENFNNAEQLIAFIAYPVKATTQIYFGRPVCLSSVGFLIPAADAANNKYVGVSRQTILGGATDGLVTCDVEPPSVQRFVEMEFVVADTLVAGDLGKLAYFVDDHTVTRSGGTGDSNTILMGRIVKLLATGASPRVLVDTGDRVL